MGKRAMMHYLITHWVELAGWTTTLLGIWLTTRRSLWCWPITLAADVLYLIVFYRAALLSDTLLQAIFIIFTLYGWWHWLRGVREEGEVKVSTLKRSAAIFHLVLGAIGSVVLGIIAHHLHAALPYLDATLTSYSLVASWWGARKYIANWTLWIVIDILYVGEYLYKDLRATALLYAILVGLAALGLRDWKRAAISTAA